MKEKCKREGNGGAFLAVSYRNKNSFDNLMIFLMRQNLSEYPSSLTKRVGILCLFSFVTTDTRCDA
jgi:hypothetical protein